MTWPDLFFLVSVLFVLVMLARIAIAAIGGRKQATVRLSRLLGIYLAVYAAALAIAGFALPRRFYAPGERRCFDDWCAAALTVSAAKDSGDPPCGPPDRARDWVATVEVSSVARRIRQRARDAHAELEDEQGKRYQPCPSTAGTKSLSDELGPGESFRVSLPFRLPPGARPAGLVLHHGDFPGVVILGADHSLLHTPALQRLTVESHP